jgi:hypothetical protein
MKRAPDGRFGRPIERMMFIAPDGSIPSFERSA